MNIFSLSNTGAASMILLSVCETYIHKITGYEIGCHKTHGHWTLTLDDPDIDPDDLAEEELRLKEIAMHFVAGYKMCNEMI